MKWKIKLSAAAALLAVASGFTLSQPALAQETLLDEIIERGSMRLCIGALAPWAFKDPATGKWDGFTPELAYIVGEELGVEVVWVELNYGTAIPGLRAGKCDAAWPSYSRTPKRAIVVDFTDLHYEFGLYVGIRADDDRWTSYEQMNNSEFIFAARPDYTEVMAKQYFPKATVRVTQSDNPNAPRLEVIAGRADATVDDGPAFAYFLQQRPGVLKVFASDEPLETNGAAWAVRPGNDHLRLFLNTFLVHMRETGRHEKLVEKWFALR